MKYLLLFTLVFGLNACQSKSKPVKPTVIPEDSAVEETYSPDTTDVQPKVAPFYFSIETESGAYNSKTETLWRLYQEDRKKYTNIELTEVETKAIKEAFEQANFNAFPDRFEPKGGMITQTIPCFTYTMTMEIEGKQKQVVYSDCETDPEMIEAGKPFLALFNAVWNLLQTNEQIKAIPKSNVMWE